MFRITQNKVEITRGQTAVYSREIRRNDKYKSPYILFDLSSYDTDGDIIIFNNPEILLSIKRNIYSNETILRYRGKLYPSDIIQGYIVGETALAADWLSLTKTGSALTPVTGNYYLICTHGNYLKQVYKWSGTAYVKQDIVPILDTQVITNYVSGETIPERGILYRFTDTAVPYYQYYDPTEAEESDRWKGYNFVIRIPIASEDTQNISPGTYYYELTIVLRDSEGKFVYKDVLLKPTEWVIGGSTSE